MKPSKRLAERHGDKEFPCICLFIDHEYCDEIGQMLGEFATKELKRLENGEYKPFIEQTAKVIEALVRTPVSTGFPIMEKCLKAGIPTGKVSEVYVSDNNATTATKKK